MEESLTPVVFVVDDEPAVRKAISLILQTGGHQVELFGSATEFLEQFDPMRPGCLISDVRMPGMDGMQMLKRLEELKATLPIFMLSAHGDISMAVRALKLGAVDFLEKPIDANVLRSKVAEALNQDKFNRLDQEERIEIKAHLATLTSREREVLNQLVNGKETKQVAQSFGTSNNTVRVQRASIMKKMRADNVADLIRMMNKLGPLGEA